MHRVCGRAQAPTAGLQHAPLALGDDDERVTRGLRIEGLAAAAASTFSRGSLSLLDRLPPPPSSARTARPYLPTTHGVEHGEWRGEHRAVVGLAGTVGGEQQGRTPPRRFQASVKGACTVQHGAVWSSVLDGVASRVRVVTRF